MCSLFLGNLTNFLIVFWIGRRNLPREYLQGVLGLPKLRLLIGSHFDHRIYAQQTTLRYALHRDEIRVNPRVELLLRIRILFCVHMAVHLVGAALDRQGIVQPASYSRGRWVERALGVFENGGRFVEVAAFAHRFPSADVRPVRMRLVLLLLRHHDVLPFAVQLRVLQGEVDAVLLVLVGAVRLDLA